MALNKIVSSGERVGKSPVGAPAFRVPVDRPRSVLRRCGRRSTQLYRAVEWDYVRLVVGFSVAAFVVVYVALGRMR